MLPDWSIWTLVGVLWMITVALFARVVKRDSSDDDYRPLD